MTVKIVVPQPEKTELRGFILFDSQAVRATQQGQRGGSGGNVAIAGRRSPGAATGGACIAANRRAVIRCASAVEM
jgi:hypothetical protein